MDYQELAKSFETGDLDPGAFRHADHIGVAYQMLGEEDFVAAAARYASGIRSLATQAGVPKKYNVTITMAFLSLVAERMRTTPHEGYGEFIANNADLLEKDVLGGWYSRERIESDLARTVFLMPDVRR